MSLINQVLNDLEKRGASTNIGEATIRVVPLQQSHATFWWIFSLLSLAVLLSAAWFKWGGELPLFEDKVVAVPSVPTEVQPATQAVANATTEVAVETAASTPPVAAPVHQPVKVAAPKEKPLVIPSPVITAVSPNPLIGNGSKQIVTINGTNYASDAKLILRTPRRNVFEQREIASHSADKIAFSVNFGSKAGPWSVEVVNPSGHSSGPFVFAVKTGAVAAVAALQSQAGQGKAEVSPLPKKAAEKPKAATPANPLAALPEGGVSKQLTQSTPQQQAENEFRKAYALMQQGQNNAAISGYETALQLDAGHLQARQTLVRLLLEQKRTADAERVLQEGLQFDPKQGTLALLLARMQVGRNELAQALDIMQKSLPYAEKQADYQAFFAALLQRQNRHKEAIDYYRIALNLKPQSGVWLMGMGISLRAEKRLDEARDAFNRALESKSLNADLQSFVTQQLKEL